MQKEVQSLLKLRYTKANWLFFIRRIENNQLATIFGDNWRLKNRDRAKKRGTFLQKEGVLFAPDQDIIK